jgi:signal transduction histidine kinase
MTIRNQLSRNLLVLVALVLGLVLLGVYVQVERQRRARYEERLRLWAYAEGVRFMESPGEVAALAPTQAMGAGSEGETPRFLALYSIQNQLLFLMDSCHGALRLDAEWLERIRSQGTGSGNVGDLEWAAVAFGKEQYNGLLVVLGGVDELGRQQGRRLAWVLGIGWVLGVVMTWILSYGFAGRALRPVSHLLDRVDDVQSEQALQFNLPEAVRNDEIGGLARKFNELMDRLREALGTRQQFLGLASHQLRTPLASMKTEIEVLLRQERSPDAYRTALVGLLQRLEDLNSTAQRLLTLVQLEAGGEALRRTPLALDEVLLEVQAWWKRHRPDAEVELHLDEQAEAADRFAVRGDEELLKTALNNLIENALKYSEEPWVQLKLRQETGATGPELRVEVVDRGRGIPTDQIPRLFEPFYRGTNSGGRPGHGLGLALVSKIAKWHGGSLEVCSVPGEGSTFTLCLPPIFGHA